MATGILLALFRIRSNMTQQYDSHHYLAHGWSMCKDPAEVDRVDLRQTLS